MDLQEPSNELSRLRAEVEKLRLDLDRIESLSRQLDGARDQLRRSTESIERRDVIIREARKQITALSRKLDDARTEAFEAKKAAHRARGTRWYALREAVHQAREQRWRWLLVPFKIILPRKNVIPPEPAAPSPAWEPPSARPARPVVARSPRSLRVAAIVGTSLRAQLEPECTLVTFGPEEWREALEDSHPHLLLMESDPFANDGSWQGELLEKDAGRVRALVAWCRERGIPTAFWNTTDPLELERWIPVESLFDNVFTVDADAVARYAARGPLTTANLAALPPSVQPRIFGSESAGRANRACFVLTQAHLADARLWSDARAILAVLKDDLDVYAEPGVSLPDPITARELSEPLPVLYRRYALAVSLPARGDAPGKIPQRVLEMLSSGIAVVAPASPDVSLHLSAVVKTFTRPEDAKTAVDASLADDAKRGRAARDGALFVLRAHTPMDRLAAIASAAGIRIDADAERRTAALVLADDQDDVAAAMRALAGQTRPADEIILGTKARPADLDIDASGARVRIVKQDGDGRALRLRELARMASTAWVFIGGADDPPDSFEQLVLRAPFADADVLVRAEDEAVPSVAQRALVAERGWPDDTETVRRWSHEGVRLLVTS